MEVHAIGEVINRSDASLLELEIEEQLIWESYSIQGLYEAFSEELNFIPALIWYRGEENYLEINVATFIESEFIRNNIKTVAEIIYLKVGLRQCLFSRNDIVLFQYTLGLPTSMATATASRETNTTKNISSRQSTAPIQPSISFTTPVSDSGTEVTLAQLAKIMNLSADDFMNMRIDLDQGMGFVDSYFEGRRHRTLNSLQQLGTATPAGNSRSKSQSPARQATGSKNKQPTTSASKLKKSPKAAAPRRERVYPQGSVSADYRPITRDSGAVGSPDFQSKYYQSLDAAIQPIADKKRVLMNIVAGTVNPRWWESLLNSSFPKDQQQDMSFRNAAEELLRLYQ